MSHFLISKLNPKQGDKILEIGCGTGATLSLLNNLNNIELELYGCDISEEMVKKSIARLKLIDRTNKVTIQTIIPNDTLPYPNNFFDHIYCESVLAIQENEKGLKLLLSEIKRILKKNGSFIFNETIWLDTTSPDEISAINDFCIKNYGIIQAIPYYPYKKNWLELLSNIGFNTLDVYHTERIKENYLFNKRKNWKSFKSKWFSIWGKLKNRKKSPQIFSNNLTNYSKEKK
jgi:ubiquinone/menaquinone biosynthesis C-methylase UbiE